MKYDPIKKSLGNIFNKKPFLRKIFYKLLDLLLLRAWHIKHEIKNWKRSKTNQNLNILDAGAGFGQYVYYFSTLNKNWKITGVDVKEEQIEDCNNFFAKIKKAEQVKFEFADLTNLNNLQKSEKYDFILSVDVMEHILEDVTVFQNFYKIMNQDAMLLISTPSNLGEDHDEHEESENTFFVDEHVRDGYDIKEIEEKLHKAGFTKVEAKYSYGTPGKISWKLSMKIPITILNVSKIFFIILPIYYLITYPFAFLLNFFDLYQKHKTGTGLIVKAWK